MPDSDKVIKGLETIRYNLLQMKHMLLADFCDDAIDLLKEQETANLYKCLNCGTWVSAENVVRCKDCKHYNIIGCSEGFGWCERYKNGHTDDWFCADGEKSE